MAYEYDRIDGERVQKAVAAAYRRMDAEFYRIFKLHLGITKGGGTRTRAEQQALYNLYRAGKGNLAAVPGTGRHEESGPVGPRALDLHDTGRDAGVASFGTVRGNWLAKNAPRFGFVQAGAKFREAWHYEYQGALINTPTPGTTPGASEVVKQRQAWLNEARGEKLTVDGLMGPATKNAIIRYQKFLGVGADGIWGPGTQTAHDRYYNSRKSQVAVDGVFGPGTKKVLQSRIGVTADGIWGTGSKKALQSRLGVAADGVFGTNSNKALQRKLGVNADGVWGAGTTRALQTYLNSGGGF